MNKNLKLKTFALLLMSIFSLQAEAALPDNCIEYINEHGTQPITLTELKQMIQNGDDVSNVNTCLIKDMSFLFYNKLGFNQYIGDWDVSNVTNMSNMFRYASFFDQYIGDWDVSNVTDMSHMFNGADSFNHWRLGCWKSYQYAIYV